MSNRTLAIRRINKDIKEITQNPLEGIGIAPIDEDLMKYVINMRLMTGPYQGYCVQLLLKFSDKYPTKPPKILIYPDQALNKEYHHHIFEDFDTKDENNHRFKKFCFDLLDNDFMKTSDEKTGWNPSYSISSLLLQVQNFISDPDMDGHIPKDYLIKQLMQSMDNYKRTFTIINEEGNKEEKIHTWKNPYPEMYSKPENQIEESIKIKLKEKSEDIRLQQIKENLTCFMLKLNYIDDPNILLGYPIARKSIQLKNRKRLELYPIPELLTYDGFLSQKSLHGHMVRRYFNFNFKFKSANNEYYNSWLPIYINKDHYEKNKNTILKSIAEITENKEFNPDQIFQVLPVILNSMIIGMYKGKATLSSSFIKCYFQFILLFKKLSQEYQVEYSIYLNDIFTKIKKNNYSLNKDIIPDIGNFFIALLFNKLDLKNDSFKKIYNALFEDFITRQMYWMFHSDELKDKMKKLILFEQKNTFYLDKFEKEDTLNINNLKEFNKDLKDKNIFNNIIDVISTDKGYLNNIYFGKEKAKEIAEKRITQSFKRLFQECSPEGKDKLKYTIKENIDFSKYFSYIKTEDDNIYDTFHVHELLKEITNEKIRNEFLKLAFESQKGNQLLIITFFAQKKVEENNFLEELEKNYGVYLDVDNFIKEMNKKLSEIKTYKELFEYVGADFIKDEKTKEDKFQDDLELIINAYEKALEKNYINKDRQPFIKNAMIPNIGPFPTMIVPPYFLNFAFNNNIPNFQFTNQNRNRFIDRRNQEREINRNRERERRSRSRSRSRNNSLSRSYSRSISRSYSDENLSNENHSGSPSDSYSASNY